MDKNEFHDAVEKYKKELIKMAGITVKALDIAESALVNEPSSSTDTQNEAEQSGSDNSQTPAFGQGAPYTGEASQDSSQNETYQDFLDKNKEYGYLKIQAFAGQQSLPIEGVNVIVSKKFSDMDKVFFEGNTNDSGIIDDIRLPAPAKLLSEAPENILPYAAYDVASSYKEYDTRNAPSVQIFPGVKSIQPIQVVI